MSYNVTKCSCGDLAVKGLDTCPRCFAGLLAAAGCLECYDVGEVEQIFTSALLLLRAGFLDGITFERTRKDGRHYLVDLSRFTLGQLDRHFAKLRRLKAQQDAALDDYRSRQLQFVTIETRKPPRRGTTNQKRQSTKDVNE